jgi:hypothetical protein
VVTGRHTLWTEATAWRPDEKGVVMGILEVILPILAGVAVVVAIAVFVDRRRKTPGSTDSYDRLTDSPRPPEAHQQMGNNDQYHR